MIRVSVRTVNQILCFVFFLLLFYLYSPVSFGQTSPSDPNTTPDLEERIRQLEERLNQAELQIPNQVSDEVNRRLPGAVAKKLKEVQKAEDDRRERWLERNQDLRGRVMVGPLGSDGAYGVKFDISPGVNQGGVGAKENIYYANITPFIRVEGWGSEISLNVRRFLQNEVVKGELRDQISKQDFEKADIYYTPINKDQVEVIVFVGQCEVPFINEVVDASVFSNKSILDKYKLNTSKAMRADIGFGRIDQPNPNVVQRQVWIKGSSFNLDEKNNTFDDFAVQVMMSLSILNRFSDINFKPVDVWGGFARIGSGKSTAGETDLVTDPTLSQEMAVFGFKIDLTLLTGRELGQIFAEFARRRKTGDITDQSWVIGWTKKLEPSKEGQRPVEVGVRFQSQQDDPDVTVSDGSEMSVGALIPLVEYNVGLRINGGYIFSSTDSLRDGELIFTTNFEVLW